MTTLGRKRRRAEAAGRAIAVCEFLHESWNEDNDMEEWPWDGVYDLYAQWLEVAHPEWSPRD